MLKDFYVFQARHNNGAPMCRALLMSSNISSTSHAYAWVDTMKDGGELTVSPIDYGAPPIKAEKVIKVLQQITSFDTEDPDQLLVALRDHLFKLSEVKLATRERWLLKQCRNYETSHYASRDVAYSSMPTFVLSELPSRLESIRTGQTFYTGAPRPQAHGLEGIVRKETPKKKTRAELWEDYQHPDYFDTLYNACLGHCSPNAVTQEPFKGTIKKSMGKRKVSTVQERVTVMMDGLRRIPLGKFNTSGYITGITAWLDENPVPILSRCKTISDWARLTSDERDTLTLEQLHWLNKYHTFTLYTMNRRSPEYYVLNTYDIIDGRLAETGTEDLYPWCLENIGEYDETQRPQRGN